MNATAFLMWRRYRCSFGAEGLGRNVVAGAAGWLGLAAKWRRLGAPGAAPGSGAMLRRCPRATTPSLA